RSPAAPPHPPTPLGGYIVMVKQPAAAPILPRPAKKTHHRDDLPVAILAAGLVRENDLVFFENAPEWPLVSRRLPDESTFTRISYTPRVCNALK
ncbi:DeoR family transcriptional regulator, partial [Salmonella enterica subsp. enterica serovar Poona]